MFKSHTILNFVWEALWCLFAVQKYVIAEKEIKMLELETLFMLVNILSYKTSMASGKKKWAKLYLKIFLKKSLNIKSKIENFWTLMILQSS